MRLTAEDWVQSFETGERMSAVARTGRSSLFQPADRSTLRLDVQVEPNNRCSNCRVSGRPAAASKRRELALPTQSRVSHLDFRCPKPDVLSRWGI